MLATRFLRFALLAFIAGTAGAAERQLQIAPTAPPPAGEKRVALVIGNSAYKTSPLRNPVNDARAMSKALAATGFKVTVIEDGTQASMVRSIREFGDELLAGGVGLFYYAGHGIQVRGRNYLIPVNADIQREDEIEFHAVDANFVVAKMDTAKNGLNLLILDACRNNPFQRSFRSSGQGLAQMDAPSGTLVAFATAPGSVAADGDGANGLYTKHLLANLSKPGLPIEQLFKEVRNGVAKDTGERQIPWESSSLRGNFFFVAPDPSQSPEAQKLAMQRAIAEAVKREQDRMAAAQAEQQRKTEETIRQLLAKQRAELEEEMRKRGQTPPAAVVATVAAATSATLKPVPQVKPAEAPKPVEPPKAATPPQPAPQLASAAPTALATPPIADSRLPNIGDRWEYRYVDTTTKQRRTLRAEVMGVSDSGILETGGFEGASEARAHAPGAQLVFREFWDFSPHFLSFGARRPGESLGTIPYMGYRGCNPPATCSFTGKVGEREKVTTPAGTFDAIKVVIDLNARGLAGATSVGTSAWREFTFWYSEQAKRVVKSTVRTRSGTVIEPDYDLELASYKLGAVSQAAPVAGAMQHAMAQTIRDVLARQRAEFEDELKKRGRPIQVASLAPTAAVPAGTDRSPTVGDRWQYSYVDQTSKQRRDLRIEVTGVSPEGILETSGFSEGAVTTRAFRPEIELVHRDLWDFSPYLLSFGSPKRGDTWKGIEPQGGVCLSTGVLCRFDGKAVSTEKVVTPAGTFDAVKIVIDFNISGLPRSIGWRELSFWYSREVKRMVKSTVRTRSGNLGLPLPGLTADYDLELVSFQLAATGPQAGAAGTHASIAQKIQSDESSMAQTIRDLLAKQRAELEEEMKKRGGLQPIQLAAAAPVSVASGATDSRLPRVGDRWQYRYTDTFTKRQSGASFEIAAASPDGVLERATFENGRTASRAYSREASLLFHEYWDFAPYMLSFAEPKAGQRWNGIPFESHSFCNGRAVCSFDGKVEGRERVATPAGTFDALKVVMDHNFQGFSGATRVWRQLTFWYSDDVKRIVKATMRSPMGNNHGEPDYDVELISYKLN